MSARDMLSAQVAARKGTSGPVQNAAPERTASDRLDSWKEIAAYLRRDESTIRRWEKARACQSIVTATRCAPRYSHIDPSSTPRPPSRSGGSSQGGPWLARLAVSPDGKWLVYSQVSRSASGIMLVENFR